MTYPEVTEKLQELVWAEEFIYAFLVLVDFKGEARVTDKAFRITLILFSSCSL
jgi:hypothetical protein